MSPRSHLPSLIVLLLSTLTARADNLVSNGDFADWSGASPAEWTHATTQPLKQDKVEGASAQTAARVDIATAAGGSLGEIRQTVKVLPNTKYTASVDVKCTAKDLAMLMIKPRAKSKELARLHTDGGGEEWTTLTLEFDSGAADNVQLLCRYSQKESAVGQTVWFTNVKLDGPSAGASAPAKSDKKTAAIIDHNAVIAPASADQYVTPDGAGDKSGKDIKNARPGAELQAAIDAAGSGNTVHIGSGLYEKMSLTIKTGGASADAMKTLAGQDTGGGLPIFRSNFDKNNPAKTGSTLFTVAPGVSNLAIRDIKVENHRQAVSLKGQNNVIRIDNVDVTAARDAFIFDGAATSADNRSTDIEIGNCEITGYTKRAVRIIGGCKNVRLNKVIADAGGKEWFTEVFPVGFHITGGGSEGIFDEDIAFVDCSSSNNYYDAGEKYWNSDGYAGERGAKNISWLRCAAYNNTDGGWDIKSENISLTDCISIGNKRNFRFWASASPIVMDNCLSAYSVNFGNLSHDCGLWSGAGSNLTLKNCTFFDDRRSLLIESDKNDAERFSTVMIENTVIIPKENGVAKAIPAATVLEVQNSVIAGEEGAKKVELSNPSPDFKGGGDAFNVKGEKGLGYQQK